jgi:cellulose synthase (UDP-forming)
MRKIVQISRWIQGFFWFSVIVAGSLFFYGQWSSGGPTLFPDYLVNPLEARLVPDWLDFPEGDAIALPLFGVLAAGFILRFIPATNGTRLVVKPILIFLGLRYLTWRSVCSLNFGHPFSVVFTIVVYIAECVCLLSFALHMMQTIMSTEKLRKRQADRYEVAVKSGEYCPSVDVFVPSYNEPEDIVRRTVIGAQAMDYPNKRIYILDDTRREHIRELARELGCDYITRPNNDHAKAGNLNHALPKTNGELIALMDADFVPFQNFLTRTIGFFQDASISLIQTPQNFYNPDFHARNLGLGGFLPNDLESFFGAIQPHRDALNSVICCGSCYVVRRESIEAIGGYYTQCCVEDYQTSLKMLMEKQTIVYLNETLSMGESTRMCVDFVDQRLRWLQGNFQVYHCPDLKLWERLNWGQRSFLFEQWVHCFSSVVRLIFLLCPLVSLYTGVAPYLTSLGEILYFFLPFWVLSTIVQGWSSDYRSSYFWTEVYGLIFCIPATVRMWELVRNPFGKVSKVTRKGVKAAGRSYNWSLTLPLMVILALNVGGLVLKLGGGAAGWWHLLPDAQLLPMVFWLSYNSVLLMVAILASIDQPVRRVMDRFPLNSPCELLVNDHSIAGMSGNISEGGAEIFVRGDGLALGDRVKIKFQDENLVLEGRVLRSMRVGKGLSRVGIEFMAIDLTSRRRLVEWLYCEVHDFKQRRKPGSLDSIFFMLLSVFQLRSITRVYK